MHLRHLPRTALATVLVACATAPAKDPGVVTDDPTSIAIEAAILTRWTGTLQPTQGRTGTATVTERQKAYGSVELIVPHNRPNRTRVRLNVSTPATAAVSNLRWGIYESNCGSGAPPVVPAETFPVIELSSNGTGSIDQEIAFQMPKEGRFHVNVLQGTGTQLSNILTCANLRRAK